MLTLISNVFDARYLSVFYIGFRQIIACGELKIHLWKLIFYAAGWIYALIFLKIKAPFSPINCIELIIICFVLTLIKINDLDFWENLKAHKKMNFMFENSLKVIIIYFWPHLNSQRRFRNKCFQSESLRGHLETNVCKVRVPEAIFQFFWPHLKSQRRFRNKCLQSERPRGHFQKFLTTFKVPEVI